MASKKKHEGCIRGFYHTRGAWYGETAILGRDIVDQVMVGMYHPEGGTTGEFSIEWQRLSGKIIPRLQVYDDAWGALHQFQDVLAAMAEVDGEDISPDRFCELLLTCSVADKTDRVGPRIAAKQQADPVREQLVDALQAAQKILAGTEMTKSGLVDALRKTKAALAAAGDA